MKQPRGSTVLLTSGKEDVMHSFLQKKSRIKVYFLKLKCEVRLMTKYPKLDDDGELSSKGVKLKGENGGFLVMSLYLNLYLNAVVL